MTPHIIEETDSMLAIDKPAGLIVHNDGRTDEPSLAKWLLEKKPSLENVCEPWISPQGESISLAGITHRIDRSTSGVILVAKTKEMYAHLKSEFKARRIEKLYRAIVHGRMMGEGKIVAEIMRTSEKPRRWYARPCAESDIRAAVTLWRALKNLEGGNGEVASFLEIEPRTGRTHQIRVHLSSIGYPIVGDHLYAPEREALFGFKRPALHAFRISAVVDGERKIFTAPLPDDFNFLDELEK